jgi:hypothetical protein
MPNNRTKGNNNLRVKLKIFLKKKMSGDTFHINQIVSKLSMFNKNYNISSTRAANLLKEQKDIVKSIGSGVWMKL